MKRTTIEFMIGWLDALRRDDVDALRAMLAPDVAWQGLRDEWSCQGPDAVIDTFAGEREAKHEVGALELIGADDRVILHASGGDIVAIEDIPLPDGIYNVFTLDGGTITRIDDYADRHAALTAAGLSDAAASPGDGPTTGESGDWPGRWTPDVRRALDHAGQEARALGHDSIGTEHVLLALAGADAGVAAGVLGDLGVARDRILATSCMGPGPTGVPAGQCLSLMPRLKQALEHSRQIADGLDTRLANTEHVLAGIVAVPDSMAVEILRRLGVNPADVQAALAERMGVAPQLLGPTRRRRRRLLTRRR